MATHWMAALDPHTGDEAGTTEGDFEVHWVRIHTLTQAITHTYVTLEPQAGDYFMGKNLAIASKNNTYLDGLGTVPENATHEDSHAQAGDEIYLWMSDHHPDGGQLFWPRTPVPFTVCLGKNEHGDDIKPELMRAFHVPKEGCVHSSWNLAQRDLRRQGAHASHISDTPRTVHARVSCSWAVEFGSLLRVPLTK